MTINIATLKKLYINLRQIKPTYSFISKLKSIVYILLEHVRRFLELKFDQILIGLTEITSEVYYYEKISVVAALFKVM